MRSFKLIQCALQHNACTENSVELSYFICLCRLSITCVQTIFVSKSLSIPVHTDGLSHGAGATCGEDVFLPHCCGRMAVTVWSLKQESEVCQPAQLITLPLSHLGQRAFAGELWCMMGLWRNMQSHLNSEIGLCTFFLSLELCHIIYLTPHDAFSCLTNVPFTFWLLCLDIRDVNPLFIRILLTKGESHNAQCTVFIWLILSFLYICVALRHNGKCFFISLGHCLPTVSFHAERHWQNKEELLQCRVSYQPPTSGQDWWALGIALQISLSLSCIMLV